MTTIIKAKATKAAKAIETKVAAKAETPVTKARGGNNADVKPDMVLLEIRSTENPYKAESDAKPNDGKAKRKMLQHGLAKLGMTFEQWASECTSKTGASPYMNSNKMLRSLVWGAKPTKAEKPAKHK